MNMKKTVFRVSGMTCGHCEKRITEAVKSLKGIRTVAASFPKKRVEVAYDAEKVTEDAIKNAIEQEGYRVLVSDGKKQPIGKVAPVFLIVLALYFIVKYAFGFDFINLIPRIDSTISLLALFATGLFTSVHCIAMCGGINLSQSVGTSESTEGKLKKPLLYNLGRVISYTVIGGIVGGIGSVLFVSQTVKGIIMLIAAVFMILMSLSMLGWLPWWLVPRLPRIFTKQANKAKKGKGPLVVGLLNGLLPCGPLQAMQLYALSTGSMLMGALSMMLFALGTVPLMLGAGLVFSMLKGKFTRGISRVSAVLVMLIAFVMVFNASGLFGWNLTASAANTPPAVSADTGTSAVEQLGAKGYAVAELQDGVQVVEAQLESSGYPSIVVQKGVPVQFNLVADDAAINGCNETVEFPAYNVEKRLQTGDNIIEFTPDKTGTISYTCWMGMIYGKIQVVDDLGAGADTAAAELPEATDTTTDTTGTQSPVSGSCCSNIQQAITEDSIAVAEVKDGKQVMTVTVGTSGYSPAVLVVQRGVKTQINIDPESLNYCNGYIDFGSYGSLDLSAGELELPEFTADQDFSFTCVMGMLNGYVKVVDDVNNVDTAEILSEITDGTQQSGGSSGFGGGCCG
jgi:copper ion binding protein